jgi:6-phosphogluconolactonase
MVREALLDEAPIAEANVLRMRADEANGPGPDAYAAALARAAGERAGAVPALDVVVLGVGEDGHTASLFPGESLDFGDRLVVAVPAHAGLEPRWTMTPALLLQARHVFVLVEGEAKRAAIERTWTPAGDVTTTPARILRECRGEVVWIADDGAAGGPAS